MPATRSPGHRAEVRQYRNNDVIALVLVALVVGLCAGYLLRPLLEPGSYTAPGAQPVASATSTPSTTAAAVETQSEPALTVLPEVTVTPTIPVDVAALQQGDEVVYQDEVCTFRSWPTSVVTALIACPSHDLPFEVPGTSLLPLAS